MKLKIYGLLGLVLSVCGPTALAESARTTAEVLAAAKDSDWRSVDPENTVYLDLAAGRVVIELAPQFAPLHAQNIRALVREKYFDGLAINRVQDNFVAQWGDPEGKKPIKAAKRSLTAEFTRSSGGLSFTALPDADSYAPQTGFVDGFPAARDPAAKKAWAVHCYATVGVGRDTDANSGGGTELYVVIGQAPRQLDRNITVAGRVLQGMELLASLPRGPAPMGFYEQPEQRVQIKQVRMAADVPKNERLSLQTLRTDTETFTQLIESRRNRRDEWYKVPAGHIDVCNVLLPVRVTPEAQFK